LYRFLQMADPNQLINIANGALARLKEIWDEMGLEFEGRKSLLQQLSNDVAYVYNNRVKMEEEHRDTLKEKVASNLEKIYRFSSALGEDVQPIEEELQQLPLKQRFEKVSLVLEDIDKKKEERVVLLEELHENLKELWDQLNLRSEVSSAVLEEFSSFSENELTLNRVKAYQQEIELAKIEKTKRTSMVHNLSCQILELFAELGMDAEKSGDEFEKSIVKGNVGLTKATIARLHDLKESLLKEKKKREDTIKEYAIKITGLWNRLEVSEEERVAFFDLNTGLSLDVLKACETELKRLEELKKIRMKEMILHARNELRTLWDQLAYNEDERRAFVYAFSEEYTEPVLNIHEKEIEKLNTKLAALLPILKMIERREEILKEKVEFEQITSDPTRLLSKKPRDPGRLLREEKIRKTIEKELPKVEAKLQQTLSEWESKNRQQFLWHGERYLDRMDDQQEREREKKEEDRLRKEREKASLNSTIGPNSKTPGKNSAVSLSKTLTPKSASKVAPLVKSASLKTPSGSLSKTPGAKVAASLQSTPGSPATPSKKRVFGSQISNVVGADKSPKVPRNAVTGAENSPFRTQ